MKLLTVIAAEDACHGKVRTTNGRSEIDDSFKSSIQTSILLLGLATPLS